MKDQEGLGLAKMEETNGVSLVKLNWRLEEKQESLWDQTIIERYGESLTKRKSGSCILKALRT